MQHCRVAPSASNTWVKCPASVQMQKKYSREEESIAATEGELAHKIAAGFLCGINRPAGIDEADDAMLGAIAAYIGEIFKYPFAPAHIETKITCPRIHPTSFGTCDAWCISDSTLYIFDFKYGFFPISAYENYQLVHYASGVLSKLGNAARKITDISMRIIQPRAIANVETTWGIKTGELARYESILSGAASNALSANPEFRAGLHCRFCSARHACGALQQFAAQKVDDVYLCTAPVELDENGISYELCMLQKAAEILKYRLTALEAQALKMLREGKIIPEFSIAQTFSREAWTETMEKLMLLGDIEGIDLRKPLEIISPAQARKKGLTKEFVSKFAKKEPSGFKLVRDDINKFKRIFKNEKC